MKLILILFFTYCHITSAQTWANSLRDYLDSGECKPLVAAHRGGFYTNYPENSLSLFRHVASGVSSQPIMIETDIRADRDGKLWLMHDASLDRTTASSGEIGAKNSLHIEKLLLKNQLGEITDEQIANFENLLSFANENNVFLMLDIKGDIIGKVANQIKNSNAEEKCLILTFNPENTKRAAGLTEKAMISALINSREDWSHLMKLNIAKNRLAIYVTDQTDKLLLKELKEAGFPLLGDPRELWNGHQQPLKKQEYTDFIERLQLDIVVTDFPLELIRFLFNKSGIDSLKNAILDIHHKKFRWMEQQLTDSLTVLLDDDVYYIHSNGWKESKHEVLDNIKTGKLRYINVQVIEADVRIKESTAVVTGKGIFSVSMEGKPLEINLYYTEVYAILPEGVRLMSRHACKI